MSDAQRLAFSAAVALLLLVASASVFHASPRFPGSLGGSLLGMGAAALMLLLLVYPLIKYSGWLKRAVTRFVSMRALLAFHVWAGVVGGLLGIVHTGHRYQSPLGIALVITMLIVIVTGFLGRYYLPQISSGLRELHGRLAVLRAAYDRASADLASGRIAVGKAPKALDVPGVPVLGLVNGIADLEYMIGSREVTRAVFTRWIVAHVVASIAMYLLLSLHVAGEIYFGLRWL